MKKFNSITIAPVRCLEVGDLIAREFLGTVISGKVTGVAYAAYQLTSEQREYMTSKNLTIPEDEHVALGGSNSYLIFGRFSSEGREANEMDHMFMDFDVNVAVFPVKDQ